MRGGRVLMAALLLPALAGAAPTVSLVSPAAIDLDATRVTLSGTALDTVTEVTLLRYGQQQTATIISASAGSLVIHPNAGALPVGFYDIQLASASGNTLLDDVLELSSDNRVPAVVAGDGEVPWPFLSGTRQAVAEWLLQPVELGRGGDLLAIELEPLGSVTHSGELIVRMKPTSALTFPNNQLESTGFTEVTRIAPPPILSGGTWRLSMGTIAPVDPHRALHLSVIQRQSTGVTATVLFAAESLTGTNPFRTAYSTTLSPLAETWSGTTPFSRDLFPQRPALTLVYTGPDSLEAVILPVRSPIVVGESIELRHGSGSGVVAEWDTDYDGLRDATGSAVEATWLVPGVYTIELKVSQGYTADTVLCRDCVTVLPPPAASSGILVW